MPDQGTASGSLRSSAFVAVSSDDGADAVPCTRLVASPTPLREQSDDVLVSLFQSGEQAAFRVLVERYQERVRNLLHSVFYDRDLVEDLAQEVFIRVYEALPQFRFESTFYTWLYRITVNKSRDELRRRKVRRWLTFQPLTDQSGEMFEKALPVQPADGEMQDLVAQALKGLPDHFRIPVVLKDMEGLSYEEIATVLQCRVGTVKSRLARGRGMLRNLLKPLLEEK